MVLAASQLRPISLAAQSALSTTAAMMFQLALGVAIATPMRIGNLLGEKNDRRAHIASKAAFMLITGTSCTTLRNTKDQKQSPECTRECIWRNIDLFQKGHKEIKVFLRRMYAKEHGYCLKKELFAFQGNKIAVQFFYEWHDGTGQWYRANGLEDWTFETKGEEKDKMRKRLSSINDVKISDEDR